MEKQNVTTIKREKAIWREESNNYGGKIRSIPAVGDEKTKNIQNAKVYEMLSS